MQCAPVRLSQLFIQNYTIKYFSKEKNARMKQNTTTLCELEMENVNHTFIVFALNPVLVAEKIMCAFLGQGLSAS